MRKIIAFIWGLLFMISGCAVKSGTDIGQPEIERLVRAWEGECAESKRLRRDLARWYNLNLSAEAPDPDFTEAYEQIVSFGGGMMGYVEIPTREWLIPLYCVAGEDGFVHDPSSAIPIGQADGHTVLRYPQQLLLESGEEVNLWVMGESVTYVVGQTGTNLCTLICADASYMCGRFVENNEICIDISNK